MKEPKFEKTVAKDGTETVTLVGFEGGEGQDTAADKKAEAKTK